MKIMKKNRLLLLSLLGLCSVLMANSFIHRAAADEAPTTFLDAPTDEAGNVLALFSSAYTNAANFKQFSGSGAASSEVATVDGRQLLYFSNVQGWAYVEFTAPVNLSGYTKFHMDVYVPGTAFNLKVRFNESASVNYNRTLSQGWNRVEFDLADYEALANKPDFTAIAKVGFINHGGQARSVFIDNMYVSKSGTGGGEEPEPTTPDALTTFLDAPTDAASDVLAFFSSAYTNAVEVKGFSGTPATKEVRQVAGRDLLYIGGLNSWDYVEFQNAVDISKYQKFHMDVYTTADDLNIKVRFGGSSSVNYDKTLQVGWNRIEFDIADYLAASVATKPNFSAVDKIGFINHAGNARPVYIDNIYVSGLTGGEEPGTDPEPSVSTDAPTVLAATPTPNAENVLPILGSTYASPVGISGFTGTGAADSKVLNVLEEPMAYIKGGLSSWSWMTLTTAQNLSAYKTLEMDVFVPEDQTGFQLKIRLDQSSGVVISPNLEKGWNHISTELFPYSELSKPADLNAVTSIGFINGGGGVRNIYISNVYALKDDTGGEEPGTDPEGYADAPTTLPDAPTAPADKVLALFSSDYTPATTFAGKSGSGDICEVRNIKIGNATVPMLYIGTGLNGWCNLNFSPAVDISKYQNLEMDIYLPASPFALKTRLQEGTTAVVAEPRLEVGWNHVTLSLSQFRNSLTPPSLNEFSQLGLINNGGYARTLYISNIYVSGDASAEVLDPELPETMAPAPDQPDTKVKSIFSDAYVSATTLTGITSQNTGTLKVLSVSPNERLIKIENGLNFWCDLSFASVDLSDRTYLHIDTYFLGEEPGIIKFMFDSSISVSYAVDVQPGWNAIDIPLAAMTKDGQDLSVVTMLRSLNNDGEPINIFFDNIYAYGEDDIQESAVDPSAPTTPAPTPPHQASKVLSFFSDVYETASELTLDNPGQPTCDMKIITVGEENYLRLSSMNWCLLKMTPTVNLDEYDYIHFDVYALSDPKIVIGLGDGGEHEGRTPWQYLQRGWKSIDIPTALLKENDADLTATSILRIFCATGFAISKLYFDNIYAYKGSPSGDVITYEIAQSPEPIMPKPEVTSMLTDKYDDAFGLVIDAADGETEITFPKVEEGDRVIKFDLLTKGSVKTGNPVNIANQEYLHLNIFNKAEGGTARLAFRSADMTAYAEVATQPELAVKDWTYVNIPVSELTAAGIDASQLVGVQVQGSGTIYLDNIYAFSGEYYEGLGEEGLISVDWEQAKEAANLCPLDQPLIGVNLGSACGGTKHGELGINYFYPTMEDLWYFKSKGVRLFRFPFAWERVQHDLNGELDMALDVAKMKEIVEECQRLGIYVMLDMHNYCRRQVNGVTYKFGQDESKLSIAHFADAWKKLATVFKDYDNIFGYDIMNEPYSLSPGVWAQAAQAAVNAIREVDTETAIVIEGENYASARTWLTHGAKLANNIADPSNNIIWQAHCYFDKDGSGHYEAEGGYDGEVTDAATTIARINPFVNWVKQNGYRGILGEFGVPRTDARWLSMLDQICATLKENGIYGTYWVAGNGYANDVNSVQPVKDFTQERAQMRVLSKYFNVESEDLPTSISNVTRQPQVAGTDAIYTLQGVKVPSQQKLAPGIYIQGGKKILVTK